jgi:NAD-dependent SIR2 family protein deacetylase
MQFHRSHYFLKLLEDKGKLLRIYSQVRARYADYL